MIQLHRPNLEVAEGRLFFCDVADEVVSCVYGFSTKRCPESVCTRQYGSISGGVVAGTRIFSSALLKWFDRLLMMGHAGPARGFYRLHAYM